MITKQYKETESIVRWEMQCVRLQFEPLLSCAVPHSSTRSLSINVLINLETDCKYLKVPFIRQSIGPLSWKRFSSIYNFNQVTNYFFFPFLKIILYQRPFFWNFIDFRDANSCYDKTGPFVNVLNNHKLHLDIIATRKNAKMKRKK